LCLQQEKDCTIWIQERWWLMLGNRKQENKSSFASTSW
jgi:hypothetical protein